jgi:hypothetical protein
LDDSHLWSWCCCWWAFFIMDEWVKHNHWPRTFIIIFSPQQQKPFLIFQKKISYEVPHPKRGWQIFLGSFPSKVPDLMVHSHLMLSLC